MLQGSTERFDQSGLGFSFAGHGSNLAQRAEDPTLGHAPSARYDAPERSEDPVPPGKSMYCQICGTRNDEELEYCRHCHQKLVVVSGAQAIVDQEAFDASPEEHFSFDEHLLERISILEEVVRRTTETVRHALSALYKLEQKILVNQTGITTLRDLLEEKRLVGREEWSELWESRMDYQLLALEKRERFAAVKEKIAELHGGNEPERFHRLLDEAEYALLALDIEGAIRALDDAHRADPTNHELAFFLGETFFNEGDGEAALPYFKHVLTAREDHFQSLVYCGVLYHEQRESARAEELLKRAVALYPDAFLPAFSLGAVYAAEGRLNEAAVLLERAVWVERVPQAYFLLGSCCYEMGRSGAAIRHLAEAVRLDPAMQEGHYLLGLAYLDRRWYRKALASLRDAQRLRPVRLGYRELVKLLAEREGPEEDGALSAKAAEGKAMSWVREAEGALKRGEPGPALSAYRQALSHDPENPTLLVAFAMACLEVDRPQEIEPVITKAVELEPSERLRATAYTTLIEALRSQGKYREGNRLGHRLLDEEGSEFAQSLACLEMAMNLAEIEEDLDDALSFARRSLELLPAELEELSLAALGWVHYKRREFDEAVSYLGRASEIGPSSRNLTHLGMALLAAGDRDRARQVLVEARQAGEQRGAFGEKVLECLKDGALRLADPPGP